MRFLSVTSLLGVFYCTFFIRCLIASGKQLIDTTNVSWNDSVIETLASSLLIAFLLTLDHYLELHQCSHSQGLDCVLVVVIVWFLVFFIFMVGGVFVVLFVCLSFGYLRQGFSV